MEVEEARGFTIQKLNEIEFLVDHILINYFSPKNKNCFKNYLLNSSILEFGKKIKLLSSIELINSTLLSKLRDLSAIRNSFAHAEIRSVEHFKVDDKDEGVNVKSDGTKKMIIVMNSNGKIRKKYVTEFLSEFKELHNYIEIELKKIKN